MGKVINGELCKKLKPHHTNKTYMLHQNKTYKHLWDLEIQTRLLISARQPDLVTVNKNKRTFAVSTEHKVKSKENENRDKYLDLARELKKLWNMKVKMIPSVVGAQGTIPKALVKGLEYLEINGQVDNFQATALQRSTRIPRRVLES